MSPGSEPKTTWTFQRESFGLSIRLPGSRPLFSKLTGPTKACQSDARVLFRPAEKNGGTPGDSVAAHISLNRRLASPPFLSRAAGRHRRAAPDRRVSFLGNPPQHQPGWAKRPISVFPAVQPVLRNVQSGTRPSTILVHDRLSRLSHGANAATSVAELRLQG